MKNKYLTKNKLIRQVKDLNSPIKELVAKRQKEFNSFHKKSNKEIFKELCFCTLTANYNAEKAIKIQKKINNGFIDYSEKKLSKELKKLGYRYPNLRAKFIVYNRKYLKNIKKTIFSFKDDQERRNWIIKNIKGLAYKEASHFLRNIGFTNYAIIDFHIIDILVRKKLIKEKPKILNKKNYLYIENVLKKLGEKLNLNMSELDLYLWYLETGKILK